MFNKNDNDMCIIVDALNDAQISTANQIMPIMTALDVIEKSDINNGDKRGMINAVSFSPQKIFPYVEKGRDPEYDANLIGVSNVDTLISANISISSMLDVLEDTNIPEDDKMKLFEIFTNQYYQFMITSEKSIIERYCQLKNSFAFSLWYKVTEYINYITDGAIKIGEIPYRLGYSEIRPIKNMVRTYDTISPNAKYHLTEMISNSFCGYVIPEMYREIFAVMSEIIRSAIYSNDTHRTLNGKYTADDIINIHNSSIAYLNDMMETMYPAINREIYLLVEYIEQYVLHSYNMIKRSLADIDTQNYNIPKISNKYEIPDMRTF